MKALAAILATLCAIGCPAVAKEAQPWAVIDGDGAGNVDPERYDVVIISVDGHADFEAPAVKRVTPGFHYVQVASTRPNGVLGDYQPFAFFAEPCVRYVLYAQYEGRGDRSPWRIVAKKAPKPAAGCKAGDSTASMGADAGQTQAPSPPDPAND